ncbi:MAG: PEP-CTERM sorting domain-containing protein [Sedimentisphaerales bacterium]|nr:PEP-CTERM sorting domain-containing protein [Sedimentisphaerales bacterium]
MKKVIGLFIVLLLLVSVAVPAEASFIYDTKPIIVDGKELEVAVLVAPLPYTIGFSGIGSEEDTQDDMDNQSWGKLYIFAELSKVDDQNVYFKFINTDPSLSPSSITEVYFDDDVFEAGANVLSGPLLDNSSAGVDFDFGGSNSKPPRGTNLVPQWKKDQTDFSALSTAPTSGNGVNSISEYFGITFAGDYDSVVSALDNDTLRIALHVQSFPDNEGSMTFINNAPEPATLAMLALGSLCLMRRRKK